MLTAAVALGTVSPVVLPNTAIEVKASGTVTDFSSGSSATYGTAVAVGKTKVVAGEMLEIASSDASLDTAIGSGHTYAFGKDKQTALDAALADGATPVSVVAGEGSGKKFVTTKVPEDANSLVIVKKSTVSSDNVDGVEIPLTSFRVAATAPSEGAGNDYSYTDGDAQASVNANKKLEYRKKNDTAWTKINGDVADKKFPATPVTSGEKAEYEVRTQGVTEGTLKLPSVPATLTIKSKKDVSVADAKKLKYEVASNALHIKGADTYKGDTLKGDLAYAVIGSDEISNLSAVKDGKLTDANKLTTADVSPVIAKDGDSIVIYVAGAQDRDTKNLILTIHKPEKPNVKQSDDDYTFIKNGSYKLDDKLTYTIKKDATSKVSEVKGTGDTAYIEAPNTVANDYKVTAKYKGKELTKEVTFADADVKKDVYLESEASENVAVTAKAAKVTMADLNKLKYKVAEGKLTISQVAQTLTADKTDKLEYGFETKTEIDKSKTADIVVDVKEGTFTIGVKGKDGLKKTINFKGVVDKEGKKLASRYTEGKALVDKLSSIAAGGTYKVVKKGTTEEITDVAKLVEGTYTVTYRTPSTEIALSAKDTEDFKLATGVDVNIRKEVSYTSPVVPSTTPTPEPKKDEPKKNEPKKEEPKKNEPKKEEPKKDDTKKDDSKDMASSTDDTKPAPAKKATAKTAKVSVKVTSKEVTNKLQTSGTKLVAKNVYKVTVKNASKAVSTSIKVNLGKKAKTVYVLDLKTGKTIKASYKKGKVTFKTKNSIAKFVIVNKAAKAKKK